MDHPPEPDALPPPPCLAAADDCYPMQLLHWLQQQRDTTPSRPLSAELEVV
ncbi:hypothetical protein [Zobellella endophytica]|uniref:hypothetical protein n=1 Tax=Zobellella endophytica TaxID=2116700 RepID=UPI001304B41F|nr:hypothetical protein [Zobellella endophytica]